MPDEPTSTPQPGQTFHPGSNATGSAGSASSARLTVPPSYTPPAAPLGAQSSPGGADDTSELFVPAEDPQGPVTSDLAVSPSQNPPKPIVPSEAQPEAPAATVPSYKPPVALPHMTDVTTPASQTAPAKAEAHVPQPEHQPEAGPEVNPAPDEETAPPAEENLSDAKGDAKPREARAATPAEPEEAYATWNASEFSYTAKPAGWYALLALFFAALIVIAILTHQWLSIGVFALVGITLAIYANRKPRTLNYTITNYGVHVGEKSYHYDSFGSFYETSDYGQRVFELVPVKRFGTLVSLPVSEEQEDDIEDILEEVLPKVETKNDPIDRLFRYFRF